LRELEASAEAAAYPRRVPDGYVVSAATTAVAAAVQAEPRVLQGRELCPVAASPAAAVPAAQGLVQYERTVGGRVDSQG
jgi:hypothetical protein